jgi:hypothetical protein
LSEVNILLKQFEVNLVTGEFHTQLTKALISLLAGEGLIFIIFETP